VAWALVRSGHEIEYGAVGFADLATERPMRPNTPIYAGSLSKPFTTLVVSKQVEAGRLQMNAVSSLYLPDLHLADGAAERITLAMLLSHTSGLKREGGDYWFSGRFPNQQTLLRGLDGDVPSAPPGERLSYSNVGYALAGLAAARASRTSYAALLRQTTRALGLRGTTAGEPRPELANGYTPAGRVLPSAAHPFAGLGVTLPGGRRQRMYHGARAMTPAFGVQTTAEDLGRFVALILGGESNGHRLSDTTRAHLTEVLHQASDDGSGWSYGLRVTMRDGRRELSHDGWFAAHRTHMLLAPDAGVGVAIVTNSDDGQPRRIARRAIERLSSR